MYWIVVAFGITLTIFTALVYYVLAKYADTRDNEIAERIGKYTRKVDDTAELGLIAIILFGFVASSFWPLAIVAALLFLFYRKCIKIVHNALDKINEKFG